MDKVETAKVVAVVQEIWPKFLDGRTPETTLEIWARMFSDDTYREVEAAVYAFAATDERGFPPSMGAIKAQIAKMREEDTTELEAWGLVMHALRNGLYGAEREFAALPPEVQRCVGGPEQLRDWAQMDAETVQSVVASNFMRSYRARAGHVREMAKLPSDVRALYASAGDALRLDAGALRLTDAPQESAEPEDDPRPAEPRQLPKEYLESRKALDERVAAEKAEAAHRAAKRIMAQFGLEGNA